MPRRRWGTRAGLLACGLLLSGCTSFADPGDGPARSAPPSSAPAVTRSCPDERADPDPDRPRIELVFQLADDLRTVTGTETVRFTPDLPTDELVFRLVPNGPGPAAAGSGLTVQDVAGSDVRGGGYESAGAAGPGGLYVAQLDRVLDPGESTELELAFTLTLGEGGFDRVGRSAEASWWASGAPLLAWEPGVGWSRAPFVQLLGETASSPVADTRISVETPAGLTVLMTGTQEPPVDLGAGRLRWTSREPVARDVSVAVGAFRTASTQVEGVEVVTGVLPADRRDPRAVAEAAAADLVDLAARFGPFPYATLTVAALPDRGGGIEYPSAILLASPAPVVLLHEVAHMWFYGMVGDDQFRDPWLDEAFASYAESVQVRPTEAQTQQALGTPEPVGGSMADYADDREYVQAVYAKGGAALRAARTAAGPAAFDAALRCYVAATAWRTATPRDLAAALADLPAATRILLQAGALHPEDLPD